MQDAYNFIACLLLKRNYAVSAATNKQRSAAKDTAKLDRETEELHRMCI